MLGWNDHCDATAVKWKSIEKEIKKYEEAYKEKKGGEDEM